MARNWRAPEMRTRQLIERPELLSDPRFATMAARTANRDALATELNIVFGKETRAFWAERLRSVPAGPVQTIAEAMDSEAVAVRGLVETVDHPHGPMRQLASIYRFSDTPVRRHQHSPLLGEHTAEVLSGLCNLDAARIVELRAAGVVA